MSKKLREANFRYGKPLNYRALGRTFAWRRDINDQRRFVAEGEYKTVEVNSCPVCGSCEYCELATIYGHLYMECSKCEHCFLANVPVQEEVSKLYSGEEGETLQNKIYVDEEVFVQRVEQIARPKIAFCKEVIRPDGVWLDVGCGTGENLCACKELGWSVKGVGSDIVEVEFARSKGIEVIHKYVRDDEFAEFGTSQVVSFFNIIEHVADPVSFLTRVVSQMQSDSYLVMEVPRHPSISSFCNIAFGDLTYRHINPPDHIHVFSDCSLEIMLDKAGLDVKSAWKFGQDVNELFSTAAFHNGKLEGSNLYERMIDISGALQQIVDENGLSDAILLIAHKQ